jgi:hypothetical protein
MAITLDYLMKLARGNVSRGPCVPVRILLLIFAKKGAVAKMCIIHFFKCATVWCLGCWGAHLCCQLDFRGLLASRVHIAVFTVHFADTTYNAIDSLMGFSCSASFVCVLVLTAILACECGVSVQGGLCAVL